MKCLILLACLALSQVSRAALTGSHEGNKIEMTLEEKQKLMDEIFEKDLEAEIEKMIDTLDADELDQLENILSKPLDEESELQMIQAELEELGMDPQDVQDMFDLSEMMEKFLSKIPDIDDKLSLDDDEYTLQDHCKLYLLGLPNKLGPLGFLALHSILESAGEAVVDVEVGHFEPSEAVEETEVQPLGDLFSRKRREIEAMATAESKAADMDALKAKAAMEAKAAMDAKAAMEAKAAMTKAAMEAKAAMTKAAMEAKAREAADQSPEDIVTEILKRRRRAIGEN